MAFDGPVDLGDLRLWCWDSEGGGEVLLLCHPASQSCRIWEHQRDAFAAAGFRVVAYSRRGFFRSGAGPDEDRGTAAGDLLRLLDRRGIDRVHLLGAAAGGIAAAAFAIAHPARIRSLILAGTILRPDEADWRALYDRLGIAGLRGKVSDGFLELGPSYRAVEPDGVARFEQLSAEALAGGSPPAQNPGCRITWAALEALDLPVLLLTGEADLYAPPPLQAMVARHLRAARLVTLREAGHATYWERPGEFNDAVLRFLDGQRHTERDGAG